MSGSPKPSGLQAQTARRARAEVAAHSALAHAAAVFARAGFADATLVLRWPEIAGAEVARIATPLKLQQGPKGATLTLRCESAAAVFLQHETQTLIARLNAYLGVGTIARLRLIPGALARASEPARHPGAPPRPASEAPEGRPQSALAEALARLGRARDRGTNLKRPRPPD
jgi:hypothetical protein